MQLPSATVSASIATIFIPVETLAFTPIYSNVLSHTVLANPTPSPVLPRKGSPLSFYSSIIAPMELTLIPGPKESALALPIPPSPVQFLVAPASLSPIHGTFPYFYSYPFIFQLSFSSGAPIAISPALPPIKPPIVELPKSRRHSIAMQVAISLLPLSKPKPCPCLVP